MGNRFGRQKKRKMRAEIEQANRRADYWHDAYQMDVQMHTKLIRDQRRVLDLVKAVMGEHFIGLDELEMKIDDMHVPKYGFINAESDTVQIATALITGRSDDMRHMLHVQFEMADARKVYAVSMPALLSLDEKLLARQITENLVTAVLREVRKAKGVT